MVLAGPLSRLRRAAAIVVLGLLAWGGTAAPSQADDDASALNDHVLDLRKSGKIAEALPLAQRALALAEQHEDEAPEILGDSLNNLALLHEALGSYAQAEPLYQRSLTIRESALGPNDINVGQTLNNLAALYQYQGRFTEAETSYKRSQSIFEAALGPEHAAVATSVNNLAELYKTQGRYAEAEPLIKRSLSIREKALGLDHPDVGQSLNNLAVLYLFLGRAFEAEPLYKRALDISEKTSGPNHIDVALNLNNLAYLYKSLGRHSEAEPLYQRSLSIRETEFGPAHPDVGQSLNNLAELYKAQGRYSDAEPLLKRDLEISSKSLGDAHPAVGASAGNIASLYELQGRGAEAEPLYKRAIAIFENALGADHPNTGLMIDNLAAFYASRGDWPQAAERWRQAADIVVRRFKHGSETVGKALTGKATSEVAGFGHRFRNLVKAQHQLVYASPARRDGLARSTFQTAQWAQGSQAAQSLAKMAARSARGSDALAAIARERQDLLATWQDKDTRLIATRSQPPGERNVAAEATLSASLAAIDVRIADIDKTLARDFSDYSALTNPEPLAVGDVQAQLRADEALVLFLDTPEVKPAPAETFVWVVTKHDNRWVRAELGTIALRDRVAALRCGLDDAAWFKEGQAQCASLLRLDPTTRPARGLGLPFDLTFAHDLYKGLFGEVDDLIRDKSLLVVPSGALTSLPFQVLVTEKPSSARDANYATASWMIRRHAITVLPSVASLKALRQSAKTSTATHPYVAFGNPLLVGRDGTDKRAFAVQSCRDATPQPDSIAVASRSMPQTFGEWSRGGATDVSALRHQPPLPETAGELCTVARALGASDADVNLGARATETRINQLNAEGALAQAGVVHVATHGLIARETASIAKAVAEPALLLTPPGTPTADDDGLLTATEVTGLKLNADWVVLSACNTAGPAGSGQSPAAGGQINASTGTDDAEALSGLARAFFYAGARALLVSHWYVDSRAAVSITTGAFAELKRNPAIGRAEALRRAMLATLADASRPTTWTPAAHPSVWAPFVVVGEGGAGR